MYCLNKIFNGSSLAICLKPYAPSNALATHLVGTGQWVEKNELTKL